MARPDDVYRALARAQAHVKPVALRDSDDDAAGFRYVPAQEVFDVARTELRRRSLVAVPSVQAVHRGKQVGARVEIQLLHAPSGTSLVSIWEGEAHETEGGLAAACTAALKGFYLATLQIPAVEPEPRDRHEARKRALKEDPKLTGQQITRLVMPAAEKAGLSRGQVLELAKEMFGVDELTQVGRHDQAGELVKAIETAKTNEGSST